MKEFKFNAEKYNKILYVRFNSNKKIKYKIGKRAEILQIMSHTRRLEPLNIWVT